MVAVAELDLELDAREERRRWPEHELVAAGLEVAGELGDAAVAVGLTRRDDLAPPRPAPRAPLRPASRPRCRARASRRRRSCGESSRLHPMGTRDLVLVRMDESAAAHDVLALDDEPIDPVRRREDEPGDRILGAAELEAVGPPDREVGTLPRLERADVVAAEDGCPPRVPSRNASRAVSARGPPRPRATSSACFTSLRRSLRSFDAEPSTPRPTRTPASR